MEQIIYHKTAASEDVHWWFIGRRFIIDQVIKMLSLPMTADILEVGCGSGGNLPLLAGYGNVYGMEPEDTAREYAQKRKIGTVLAGSLPDEIPFNEQLFDLIVMTDVLEHLTDDQLALQRLYPKLKTGGYILITVPAFPFLWSKHDELHHHKRRYTMKRLRAILLNAGYDIVKASYLNFIMFPAIAGLRLTRKFIGKTDTDDLRMYPAMINRWLAKLFASEGYLLRYVALPFGLSLLGVGRKV